MVKRKNFRKKVPNSLIDTSKKVIIAILMIVLFTSSFTSIVLMDKNNLSEDYTRSYSDNHIFDKQENNAEALKTSSSEGPIDTFIHGIRRNISNLDPIDAWDITSIEVIDQVCEGLFKYNLSDPYLAIIPNLALSGTWNVDATEFTCILRSDIKFHDGTPFNATAVKWNFDRLYRMIDQIRIAELYQFPDQTNIVKEVQILNEYAVKFVLNGSYVPFDALLCFTGSYMLSPTAHAINWDTLIDTATGDLVGTGPFVYDEFIPYDVVNFHAFNDYWRGKAKINILNFSIIYDNDFRNQALLDGDIDFLNNPSTSFLNDYMNAPNITVIDAGYSTIIQYLGMNNKRIPNKMREAMSYALNYDYIINNLLSGEAIRLRSPIPLGIRYANWDYNVPIKNISYARQILIDSGLYGTLPSVDDDDAWEDLAVDDPIATYNYTYNTGNQIRTDMLIVIQNSFSKIGVKVTDAGMSWQNYINRGYEIEGLHRNMLELFFIGWMPDYNDPSNFINPLMTNKAIASNMAQIDSSLIQQLMGDGLEELDPIKRAEIYDKIQKRVVEDIFPWCFCYVPKNYDAYRSDFTGHQPNAMDKVWFYSMRPARLIFGTPRPPSDIDPHMAWDKSSIDVIDQVCEGLFRHNLSHPDVPIIPNLATDFGSWSPDKKNYTVSLRSDVKFHDGTPFNATAVDWSFDRLAYFMNVSGTLPGGKEITQFDSLYRFEDGTPIINRTDVINDYSINFTLNRPFVPFEALLSFPGSYILSPTSADPINYIDTATGDLVGTGPFVYDEYNVDSNVTFHAFKDYWRGKALIEELIFKNITDSVERNLELLAGGVDLLDAPSVAYLSMFESDPDITVVDAGTSATIHYLGMNNQRINRTMRKAISYALDYDYIINTIMSGEAERLKSPIPEPILYANSSFDIPEMNITKARQALKYVGWPGTAGLDINIDADWFAKADSGSPLANYNYTYNSGNSIRAQIFILLKDNLRYIGVNVTSAAMTWDDYMDRALERNGLHRDMLELFWMGWMPDYNDPSNFINPLMTNRTIAFNMAQIDNATLQQWMEDALEEHDPVAREALYDQIQQNLIEYLYPHCWGYVSKNYDAYRKEFLGYQSNALEKVCFYNVSLNTYIVLPYKTKYKWYLPPQPSEDGGDGGDVTPTEDPPGDFRLSTTAENPDTDGIFNLMWESSDGANNYSLYVYISYITEINESVFLLVEDTEALFYRINLEALEDAYEQIRDYLGLTGVVGEDVFSETTETFEATVYFVVVAYNNTGSTFSNCVDVTVEVTPPEHLPDIIPFGNYYLLFIVISMTSLVIIIQRKIKLKRNN